MQYAYACRIHGAETVDVRVAGVSGELRHTELSTLKVETPYDPSLERYSDALADLELLLERREDGEKTGEERLFRGVVERVSSDEGTGATTVHAVGRGWYLDKDDGIREFQNVEVWQAIETYLAEETDFNYEVTPGEGTPVLEQAAIQDLTTTSEFDGAALDVADTDPVAVRNDRVELLQTCWVMDGADAANEEYSLSDGTPDQWTGGRAGRAGASFNTFTVTVSPEYTIPEGELLLYLRAEQTEDTSGYTRIEFQTPWGADTDIGIPDGLQWDSPATGGVVLNPTSDVEPGTHSFELDVVTGSDSDEYAVSDLAVLDQRFLYDFDDTTHEPEGHLDGPQEYPAAVTVELAEAETETNITRGYVDAVLNDPDGANKVGVTFDGGSTWREASSTSSADWPSDTATVTVSGRVTLSRFGERDTATPRTGYRGQALDEWTLSVDTNSVAVIEQQVFSESHLGNLRNLCQQGRMRFVIDHTADAPTISVFPRGTEPPGEVEWSTLEDGVSRDQSMENYANRVVVRGALKPEDQRESSTDLRWEAVVESDHEIERRLEDPDVPDDRAVVTATVTDPRLESQQAVNNRAFQELSDRIGERTLEGSLEIVPAFVPPGYEYAVPELDGERMALNNVVFSTGASGTLDFSGQRNWVSAFGSVSTDVTAIKQVL